MLNGMMSVKCQSINYSDEEFWLNFVKLAFHADLQKFGI